MFITKTYCMRIRHWLHEMLTTHEARKVLQNVSINAGSHFRTLGSERVEAILVKAVSCFPSSALSPGPLTQTPCRVLGGGGQGKTQAFSGIYS